MPVTEQSNITKSNMDANGMVDIWDIPAKQWKKIPCVDAREYLAAGTGCLSGPDVEMRGPAGRIKVCQVQVPEMQSQGYVVVNVEEFQPHPEHAAKDKAEEPEKKADDKKHEPEPYNFMQHNVPQLKDMASKARIADYEEMNKQQLCAALDASGWRPDAQK